MLSEPYQRYAPAVEQRPVHPAGVELRAERPAVAWVPSGADPNVMVPVLREYVQPMPMPAPRDLTPQPLFDPLAQRMLAGGVGVGAAGAGVGFGLHELAAGVALMGTSGLAMLAALLLAAGSVRGRSVVNVRHETHVTQKWFGRTDITHHG
ncbi:hypothetical protein [Streptomyces sp. NRRL S-1022]|uniref:hypothetical protein n=1 Tax=Streptomyces sp. NRRL S-1022 TaxID=1463880 RepID=UPI00068B8DF6|nr:hypothetical protein [Streptomyces sp. NRRL S-1022]